LEEVAGVHIKQMVYLAVLEEEDAQAQQVDWVQ
jgi:hypothetical protein